MRTLSSLVRTGNNFPIGHPSSNHSRLSTFNLKFFSDELPEKKIYFVDMSILSILLSPGSGYHNIISLVDRRQPTFDPDGVHYSTTTKQVPFDHFQPIINTRAFASKLLYMITAKFLWTLFFFGNLKTAYIWPIRLQLPYSLPTGNSDKREEHLWTTKKSRRGCTFGGFGQWYYISLLLTGDAMQLSSCSMHKDKVPLENAS
jgi:hypothetical protein